MKTNKVILMLAALGLLAAQAPAQTVTGNTFTDPLNSGTDPYINYTTSGSATLSYASGVTAAATSGGLATGSLIMPSSDGNIPSSLAGDFTGQISYANLNLTNIGYVSFTMGLSDGYTVEMYVTNGGSSSVFNTGVYASDGSLASSLFSYNIGTGYTSGTFTIGRSGNALTATYASGGSSANVLNFTDSGVGNVESFDFSGSGQDPTSINFSDVSLSNAGIQATATPEPSSIALGGLGAVSWLVFRRRK